ncbi:MAG: hypothetical protein Q8R78_07550, partial [Candidatus Omnitrophota bacterium]|nr:hypothetical protein [Candidatus Omnitrophota bacterium]
MRHDVRKGLWSFAIIASLGLAHVAGWAAIPTKIAHQGRLLDSADQPITSAVSVTFALYAVDTGGSALWSESQTIDPDDQGFYETFLGETTTLPSNLSDPLYLQMTVGIEILTPRLQVGSVPFALRAGDLECADCVASTEIAPETIVDADISASAAIAGTKTSPNFGSQNILTLGNVGIGTTTPGAKLTVNGPMIRQLARVQGYSSDDTDDGVLSGRLLSFIKTQNDTGIRVSWSDNFRVRGSDKACRW